MADTSFFRALWPDARTQLDGVYGEQVTLSPQARKPNDPDARMIADPGRLALTVVGIWDDRPSEPYPQSRMMPEKATRQIADNEVLVTIAKARLPYRPTKGDVITRLSAATTFKVSRVEDTGEGDWLIYLSTKG